MSELDQMSTHPEREQSSVEISLTQPDDFPALSELLQETWLSVYPNDEIGLTYDVIKKYTDNFVNPESQHKIRDKLKDPDLWKWTARVDGKIAGFTNIALSENRIYGLYVHPDYQGQGVGHQLFETAIAALDGSKPIHINVATYNEGAIRFYERHGFVFDKESSPFDVSGVPMPTQDMIRE